MRRDRRTVLAGAGTVLAGSLSGCLFGGGSDDDGADDGVDLSDNNADAILSAGDGISVSLRSVSHNSDENTANVDGAVDVSREAEYRVRLGVVDQSGIVLAESVETVMIYPTGPKSVTAEIDVDDCEACHTGLVEAVLSESARREIEQEREQAREEREQEQQQQQEQEQAQSSPDEGGDDGDLGGGA